MEYVKLTNRTKHDLRATWDGRVYWIKPGDHSFPRIVAEAFKKQNPIMGSEDPYNLTMDYLVGIEEWGDPVTTLTDEEAFPKKIERFDRSKLINAKPTEVIKGDTRIFSRNDVAPVSPVNGPVTSSFVSPTV